jgi:ribosomal protein L11 methyltransferase
LLYAARMPHRVDFIRPPHDAFDRLVQLGALDIELIDDGLAAILPDSVTLDAVTDSLRGVRVTASTAVGRDNDSVWLLRPRAVRIGSVQIAPPEIASSHALRLTDSNAFGTGHHPTTALCVEAIEETVSIAVPRNVLDVGTGSGVLALAALMLGASRATGVDTDPDALEIAAHHARLNNMAHRMDFALGGPEVVRGSFPLAVANVLAAPLIEMAPVLVRRVGNGGRLILSGIAASLEPDVRQVYQRLGMRHVRSETRAGWALLVLDSSW